jgi:hypothetical protein
LNTAHATDAIDGNVDVVYDAPDVFPLGVTTVYFDAVDTSGNTGSAQATVTVVDQTKPVVTLTGNTSITLSVGDSFVEPGFAANDNVDGDITDSVVASGVVDTSSVGTYTLSYDVSDNAGNVAITKTRQVTVEDPNLIDSDGDGVADVNDAFPNDPSEWIDTDGDGIGNNADPDDDNDGILDEDDEDPLTPFIDTEAPVFDNLEQVIFEATGEFTNITLSTPVVTDNIDRDPTVESNIDESLALGTHQVLWTATDNAGNQSTATQTVVINDSTSPIFNLIEPLEMNAKGRLTNVFELINATAFDLVDGEVPVTTFDETQLVSGEHSLTIVAADRAGNEVSDVMPVIIYPEAIIADTLVVSAGGTYSQNIILSGQAPDYPAELSYQITKNGNVIETTTTSIDNGTQVSITFTVPEDATTTDSLVLNVISATNAFLDDASQTTLIVIDNNIAPQLSITIHQNDNLVSIIDPDLGVATITATTTDVNSLDNHDINWLVDDNSLVDEANDNDESTFEINPIDLVEGVYSITISSTENNTVDALTVSKTKQFVVEILSELSTELDSDNDGIADSEEGYSDTDGDGIADYLDNDSNTTRLPSGDNTQPMQTSPGLIMSLGSLAASQGSESVDASLTTDDLAQLVGDDSADTTDSHFQSVTSLYNFNIKGLTVNGESVYIVMPLEDRTTLPADAVYRKYNTVVGWYDFVEDENNWVSSAQKDENGNCPATKDAAYTLGLTEEDNCIQLVIEDGGPNDADFTVNGAVEDPGAVGIEQQNNAPIIVLDNLIEVNEETEFTLDASNTTDADGDPLNFSWVQTSGIEVELTDPTNAQLTLVSPSVSEDEILTFELTVDDGIDSSISTMQITVYQVNKAPVVSIDSHNASFPENTLITITAQGSDHDGDDVKYLWEQLSGPSINFSYKNTAKIAITLPEVSSDETVVIQITVSDGELSTSTTTSFIIKQIDVVTKTPQKESGGSIGWLLMLFITIYVKKTFRLKRVGL